MSAPQLHCLFHSSPTVALLLNAEAGRALAGDLLVECAPAPALGFALGLETPANYPGIVGLLGGTDIASLAHESDRLPAPIVLAPGTPVQPAATRAALARLTVPDDRIPQLTLLVPLDHAPALGAALAVASQCTLAWDVSEFPHEEMLAFARWLGREQLIPRDRFAGVVAYASQPITAAHAQRLTTLLAPLATPAHPAGVITLAS
jgi:hypothetical protein